MDALSGCLLINKKVGVTSRYEVNKVSKILNEKKCGHIGTLDPFASGLLIVLVGKATKISQFLEVKDKTYIASLKLGEQTDTGDKDGKIIKSMSVPTITKKDISNVLNSFLGENEQLPPMYSALKKDGKHYYDYAREGIEIERTPRKINIYDIMLLDYQDNIITFVVHVSKGCYVRTLGEEIASRLNCVGHLINLERTKIGSINVLDSISSDEVTIEKLIPIEEMLKDYESILLDGKNAFKAINGVDLMLPSKNDLVLVKDKNGLIAMYQRKKLDVYSCLRGLR